MRIAQRGGTSSTATSEFVVDRFRHAFSKASDGVTVTHSQGTLGTSDSPYSEGHRYYIRESLSGSTSDASSYYIQTAETRLEARDIATSGWNYTDPNSELTLSFWARSSVAMTYGYVLQTHDGTAKLFPKSFALSANTWTKIKYSVPGHADLSFDNDTTGGANIGFTFKVYPYLGSGYCGGTDGAWSDQSAGKYGSDNTAVTWLGGANTFDVTGLQLEVGSQATAFEHRSFGEELALCMRYFYGHSGGGINGSNPTSQPDTQIGGCSVQATTSVSYNLPLPVTMRAIPSIYSTVSGSTRYRVNSAGANTNSGSDPTMNSALSNHNMACGAIAGFSGLVAGQAANVRRYDGTGVLGFDAEL